MEKDRDNVDGMELDPTPDGDIDENLLAYLEEQEGGEEGADGGDEDTPPPLSTATTTPTAPAPPLQPTAVAGESRPTQVTTIDQLLNRYEAGVVVTMLHFDEACQAADEKSLGVQQQMEQLLALCGSHAAMGGELRDRINLAREQVIRSLADWSEAAKRLRIFTRLAHANMEVLLTNEIYNHLARGPQDAPYRVSEAMESVEIGFSSDNPALPARSGAPVDTVRVRMF